MIPAFSAPASQATRHEAQIAALIQKAVRAEGHMKALPRTHAEDFGRHDGNTATSEARWNCRVESIVALVSQNGEMTRAEIITSFPNFTPKTVEQWVGAAWKRGKITARFIRVDGVNRKLYRVAEQKQQGADHEQTGQKAEGRSPHTKRTTFEEQSSGGLRRASGF